MAAQTSGARNGGEEQVQLVEQEQEDGEEERREQPLPRHAADC